ncbi:MAG: MCE family protein, partial [Candidatus Acidiferrales bacterium]
PKYQIQMFIPESSGVQAGASVRLDGLPVGSVTAVRLAGNSADSNRRIELVLRIEKRFMDLIRDDSTATLLSDGLLGNRYVSIQRGSSGRPIQAGGEIRVVPAREITVTDFIGALEKMANCQNEEKNSSHPRPAGATNSQKSE